MAKKFIRAFFVLTLVIAAWEPASAEVGLRGWGPRVGVSSDPDQVVGGIHFDLGDIVNHLRWQPSVEFGAGDDAFTFAGNMMVAWYFPVNGSVTPYAGGQLSVFYINWDEDRFGRRDDSDTEIGLSAVGGIETKLRSGTRFLVELQLGLGDVPDAKVMTGWTF